MKTNIQNAINIIENSLTGTTLTLSGLKLTTKDLIYIFSIEKYKSFFENLEWLNLSLNNLSLNKIKKLQKGVFSGLKNLEYLILSYNKIKKLSNDIFSGLEKLKYLDLSYNKIEELSKELENKKGLIHIII